MIATTLDKVKENDVYTHNNGETWVTVAKIWKASGGGTLVFMMVTGHEVDSMTSASRLVRLWGYTGDEVIVKI